jgi:glycosyltransferase involved in cell wall biosynthesis
VNLVAFENGVGNSRDIVLVAEALRGIGCEVTVTAPSRHARRRRKLRLLRTLCRARLALARRGRGQAPQFDLNVMLEHIWPEELHRARHSVVVPNPEFFDRHDRSLLSSIDAVWAKTRNTLAIFEPLGRPTVLIGFDSVDRVLHGATPERTFLHVAGKSRMKGTARLLAVWRRHPEWPMLTVVQSLARAVAPAGGANVRVETSYLSDEALRQLQNLCGYHLCTSETEGWGHYLAEAESIGAIVLATDAPPMNELVTVERGILLPATARGRQNLATTFEFDERAFEERVHAALALEDAARQGLGAAARDWFRANKLGFAGRLAAALARL